MNSLSSASQTWAPLPFTITGVSFSPKKRKFELTPFTRSDEWQFEKLYRREKERNYQRIDGKRVQVEPNFNKLSPQLQDLIRKRFETLNPDGNFDAIELGEKYL